MIKYKIATGAKHVNVHAQQMRDGGFKPFLKGMHCRKCTTDTIIEFFDDGTGHARHRIYACCPEFEQRINEKLWPS